MPCKKNSQQFSFPVHQYATEGLKNAFVGISPDRIGESLVQFMGFSFGRYSEKHYLCNVNDNIVITSKLERYENFYLDDGIGGHARIHRHQL